jgi:hypothetical protein
MAKSADSGHSYIITGFMTPCTSSGACANFPTQTGAKICIGVADELPFHQQLRRWMRGTASTGKWFRFLHTVCFRRHVAVPPATLFSLNHLFEHQ